MPKKVIKCFSCSWGLVFSHGVVFSGAEDTRRNFQSEDGKTFQKNLSRYVEKIVEVPQAGIFWKHLVQAT